MPKYNFVHIFKVSINSKTWIRLKKDKILLTLPTIDDTYATERTYFQCVIQVPTAPWFCEMFSDFQRSFGNQLDPTEESISNEQQEPKWRKCQITATIIP